MGSDDAIEPRWGRGLIFASEDFDDVALFEFFVHVGHFAVDFDADSAASDGGMEFVGEV